MGETVSVAKSVVARDGKVLVLTRADGRPDLPGGRLEEKENFEQCLHREIQEETGITVRILWIIAEWRYEKGPELTVAGITYLCEYLSGDVKLSSEHREYCWMTPVELEQLGFNGHNFRRGRG
jgi:8-oxo-dGTP diphosphatase